MKTLIILFAILIALFVLYVLSLKGRTNNADVNKFMSARFAHRGLHKKPYIPENSLSAFEAAADKGYGIELDIHLMADGKLAVIHDASLKRTAGADIKIEDLTTDDLKNYSLESSNEHIPLFSEVLELIDGRVPLLIELKAEGNCKKLCAATVKELEGYKGDYCIESFDPRCVYWFCKNKPDVVRGQLVQNFIRDKKTKLSPILKVVLTSLVLNFVNKPDFIAHKFSERKSLPNQIALKLWKMKGFTWTLTSNDELLIAEKEGYAPIFEQFNP